MDITTNAPSTERQRAWKFIMGGWFIATIALFIAGLFFTYSDQMGFSAQAGTWIKALIMSTITIGGIIWLATRLDQLTLRQIGLTKAGRFTRHFLLGLGLIFIPFLITLGVSIAFGWVDVRFNVGNGTVRTVLSGLAITFLFEALPEELAFRGYIFQRLNTVYRRWLAGLISVVLFALTPVALFLVNRFVLGIENSFGGANGLPPSYLIVMILFGAFLVYLRVLTNSIAMGVGFHLGFVHFDRLMGLESYHLVQFTDASGEGPMQMVLLGCFLLMVVGLFLYPRWKGIRLGWRDYAMMGRS